ncbi:MAG: hypothetical protein ACRD3B_09780 [Candidatus Sulfotelmatobacter sp.]
MRTLPTRGRQRGHNWRRIPWMAETGWPCMAGAYQAAFMVEL